MQRLWGDTPNIGTQVAEFSRTYFLSVAIVLGTVVSAYDWALFNFDRVCDGATEASPGEYNVKIFDKLNYTEYDGVINVNFDKTVRVCNTERCCQQVGFRYPPIPSRFEDDDFKWMTNGQRIVTGLCGWFSVVVLVVFFLFAFGHSLWNRFINVFVGSFDVRNLNIRYFFFF